MQVSCLRLIRNRLVLIKDSTLAPIHFQDSTIHSLQVFLQTFERTYFLILNGRMYCINPQNSPVAMQVRQHDRSGKSRQNFHKTSLSSGTEGSSVKNCLKRRSDASQKDVTPFQQAGTLKPGLSLKDFSTHNICISIKQTQNDKLRFPIFITIICTSRIYFSSFTAKPTKTKTTD